MNDKQKEFEELVRPLMKWLNDNYHPMCSICINPDSAEVVEGIMAVVINDYIKD